MPIASPQSCPLGKTYFYDPPTTFNAFWTNIANRLSTRFNDIAVVVDGAYAPSHVDDDLLTFFSGNDYGASQETTELDFESLSVDVVLHFSNLGGTSGSGSASRIEIGNGIKIHTGFSLAASVGLVYSVTKWNNALIYSSTPDIIGTGNFTYDAVKNIKVTKSGAIYNVWVNDIQVVTNHDAEATVGPSALGDQKIYLSSVFLTFDEPPAVNRRLEWHRFKNIYIVGTSLPSTCLGPGATQSAILPSSTGKISHARILKGHRGPSEAAGFHNAMRVAT